MSQSPIFTKTHDFLLWLIPRTTVFPREQRFVLARKLQNTALCFQECLIEAGSLPKEQREAKLRWLNRADVELTKLRYHLRLCHDLELLRAGQYRHAAGLLTEIGRLLGGWFKSLEAKPGRQTVAGLPA